MKQKILNVVSLGCAKNLVDSEKLMFRLQKTGCKVLFESEQNADIVLINTCGFIEDAKEESIDTILSLVKAKRLGKYNKIIVFGCLSQRYMKELRKEIPEVDHLFGVNDHNNILEIVGEKHDDFFCHKRVVTTPSHYAYLKVSEGCSRKCSFCIIPSVRGKYVSIKIDDLIKETQFLSNSGVKEIILVAQDLSSYGKDLCEKSDLNSLINELEKVNGIEWIRLHYLYPSGFPQKVMDTMAKSTKILNYIDVPFQHASDKILKSMRRGHTATDNRKLINKLRKRVPNIAIRTTVITGYPGETDNDFKLLYDFVKESEFERLGVFTYSKEEGTHAANLIDDVPPEIKTERAEAIRDLQADISMKHNKSLIGKKIEVIIDRYNKDCHHYIGRTHYDSPEVDQEVVIDGETQSPLKTGSIIQVRITGADCFELQGKVAAD